jgi:murein DD-endopeptidase MepM/ murein hydrolase activator NlpD
MISKWEGRKLRSDSEGDGAFASRRGGKRHKGADFEFEPDETVRSPISGLVTRVGLPYEDAPYRLIEILSHKGYLLWRFLYVKPSVKAGDRIEVDQTIGTAQDISKRYSGKMIPHVHVEINIDPWAVIGGK